MNGVVHSSITVVMQQVCELDMVCGRTAQLQLGVKFQYRKFLYKVSYCLQKDELIFFGWMVMCLFWCILLL